GLLMLSRDWVKAEHYLNNMPEDQRSVWSQKIDDGRLEDEYQNLRHEKDTSKLPVFIKKYGYALDGCRQTGVFIEAAGLMAGSGETSGAERIYNDLLRCGQEDWKFRLLIYHEMEMNLPVNEALASVENEIVRRQMDEEYAGPLSALRMRLLMKKFSAAESMSPDYFETGDRILELVPEDRDIRGEIAWTCFNGKDYQCALKHFEILSRDNPMDSDYLKGLVYSLVNTGNEDNAVLALQRFAGGTHTWMSDLMHDLYSSIAGRFYKEENPGQAEYFLLKALEIKPGERNDRTLLAWTYYRQHKYSKAVKLFEDLYRTDKSPDTANNLMAAFEKLSPDEQTRILSETGAELDDIILKFAADRNYNKNAPMTAAYIFEGEETCYKNCNSPVIEFSGNYRHKSGDKGLSRLNEFSFPLRFHYPVRTGREWVFSITPIYLNSEDAPSAVYTGHYYRYLNDTRAERRSLTHAVTVYEPEISYRTEGPVEKQFMIGITPLNGPADPMPRFSGRIENKDRWFIQLRQDSVRESILSYVGLK
ncbi:MAG: tetratricopeptide repeat protein, partial [Nitrospirota bacterium]